MHFFEVHTNALVHSALGANVNICTFFFSLTKQVEEYHYKEIKFIKIMENQKSHTISNIFCNAGNNHRIFIFCQSHENVIEF